MKKIEEMSDHELLMELVAEKRRNDKLRFVRYGIYALIAVFVIAVGMMWYPKIKTMVGQYNELMNGYHELMDGYQDLMGRLAGMDERISDFMGTFETDFGGKLKDLMEKINALMGRFGF